MVQINHIDSNRNVFNPNLVTPVASEVNYFSNVRHPPRNLPPVATVRRNNIPQLGTEEIESLIHAGKITPTTNMSGTEVGNTVVAYPLIGNVRQKK